MKSPNHLVSLELRGGPLIARTMAAIATSYLLSRQSTFFVVTVSLL